MLLNFVGVLTRQIEWSRKAFGPSNRWRGILDHIRKEIAEVEAKPDDTEEWIDLAILAFDGAWRGLKAKYPLWSDHDIALFLEFKYSSKIEKNEARTWPDWRTADPDKAIEHDRSDEPESLPLPTHLTEHDVDDRL